MSIFKPHDHEFNRIEEELALIAFHRRELADAETMLPASTGRPGYQRTRTRRYRLPT